GVIGIYEDFGPGNVPECFHVARREPTFCLDEATELLELGTAEGGIDIGEPVIVADLIVHEGPLMRLFGGRLPMLRRPRHPAIRGEDRATAAGRDHLVAVEAECRHLAVIADMATLVA